MPVTSALWRLFSASVRVTGTLKTLARIPGRHPNGRGRIAAILEKQSRRRAKTEAQPSRAPGYQSRDRPGGPGARPRRSAPSREGGPRRLSEELEQHRWLLEHGQHQERPGKPAKETEKPFHAPMYHAVYPRLPPANRAVHPSSKHPPARHCQRPATFVCGKWGRWLWTPT